MWTQRKIRSGAQGIARNVKWWLCVEQIHNKQCSCPQSTHKHKSFERSFPPPPHKSYTDSHILVDLSLTICIILDILLIPCLFILSYSLVISFVPMSLTFCDRIMLNVHQAFQYSLPGHFPVGSHDWVLNNRMWAKWPASHLKLSLPQNKTRKCLDSWAPRDTVGEK